MNSEYQTPPPAPHHSASPLMPNCNRLDRFSYPSLTHDRFIYSYRYLSSNLPTEGTFFTFNTLPTLFLDTLCKFWGKLETRWMTWKIKDKQVWWKSTRWFRRFVLMLYVQVNNFFSHVTQCHNAVTLPVVSLKLTTVRSPVERTTKWAIALHNGWGGVAFF